MLYQCKHAWWAHKDLLGNERHCKSYTNCMSLLTRACGKPNKKSGPKKHRFLISIGHHCIGRAARALPTVWQGNWPLSWSQLRKLLRRSCDKDLQKSAIDCLSKCAAQIPRHCLDYLQVILKHEPIWACCWDLWRNWVHWRVHQVPYTNWLVWQGKRENQWALRWRVLEAIYGAFAREIGLVFDAKLK